MVGSRQGASRGARARGSGLRAQGLRKSLRHSQCHQSTSKLNLHERTAFGVRKEPAHPWRTQPASAISMRTASARQSPVERAGLGARRSEQACTQEQSNRTGQSKQRHFRICLALKLQSSTFEAILTSLKPRTSALGSNPSQHPVFRTPSAERQTGNGHPVQKSRLSGAHPSPLVNITLIIRPMAKAQ